MTETTYVTYDSIVESFATVVFAQTCGMYQGDIVYGLRDEFGRPGICIVGYGSCSGCDELEAIRPYTDEWSDAQKRDMADLTERIRQSCYWGIDTLLERDWEGASWALYDREVRAALWDALEAVGVMPPFEREKDD